MSLFRARRLLVWRTQSSSAHEAVTGPLCVPEAQPEARLLAPVLRWLRCGEGFIREQPCTPSSEDRDSTTYVSSKNLELKQDKLNSSVVLGPDFMAILFLIS